MEKTTKKLKSANVCDYINPLSYQIENEQSEMILVGLKTSFQKFY